MDDSFLLINCEQCSRNNQLIGRIGFVEVNGQIIVNYRLDDTNIQYLKKMIRNRNQFQHCKNQRCNEKYLINEEGFLFRERPCKLHRKKKLKLRQKHQCYDCTIVQERIIYSKCPKCQNPIIYRNDSETDFNCCYCLAPICSTFKSFQQMLPQMQFDHYSSTSNKFIYFKCIYTFLFLFIFSFVFIFTGFIFVIDQLNERINTIYLTTLEKFQQSPQIVKIIMIILLAIVFIVLKYFLILIFWIPGAIYQFYTYLRKAYQILEY